MSVAFRRESDEEHKEPRFELPIPPGPNLVTARGLRLIEARVLELETIPPGETDEGRTERERDLRYWRARFATAQVAPAPNGAGVAFGTRVTLRQNGTERVVAIVGHDEGDPATGSIGFAAPLARALMRAEVGDVVEIGKGSAEILAIDVIGV